MKRILLFLVVVSGISWAGPPAGVVERDANPNPLHRIKGIYIGPDVKKNPDGGLTATPLGDTDNQIFRTYGKCISYIFPAFSALHTVQQSPETFRPGIRLGDPCMVGVRQGTYDGGWSETIDTQCQVSRKDYFTISARASLNEDGGFITPRDAGFCVRIFSSYPDVQPDGGGAFGN